MSLARLSEEKERLACVEETRDSSTTSMFTSRRRVALDLLLVCWGLGTWLGVNGLFVQLPLLVERLPEGWSLPSAMSVAIQSANIGLLIYASLRKVTRISDTTCIYGLLAIGTIALFLNSFLFPKTVLIGDKEKSVAFLTLTFFVALVGCTSSVLFYPYLRHYREIYLATYLVGEGLSGFIPSIIALIQGVGGEPDCVPAGNNTFQAVFPPPRFDSTVFIVLLGILSALSLISFCILHNYSGFSSERVKEGEAAKEEEASLPRVSLLKPEWIGLMVLMAVLNALSSGVMPSIQSFSCLPYGRQAYHLSVTLGAMANPTACLAGVWLKPVRGRWLTLMLTLSAVLLAYIFVTAVQSPTPPLYTQTSGVIIIVVSWVVCSGLVSYARMWVFASARRGGARGMRQCGALSQLGSAFGSITLYCLINYTQFFNQAPDCPARPS
ncbi:unnamed protein product [Leptosia nina]|uniref:Riboflavin transporter n=1 Tax=Leptosia nina TaxID=320188 RepID=A0AAV1JLL3_9NEOP